MTPPVLRDIPEAFETERLLIRAPQPGDGPEVNRAIRESFEALRIWMDWATQMPTVEETEALCRRSHAHFLERSDLPLFFFLKAAQTCVGASGLHPRDWNVPRFEIGYWVRTSFQGQGFVTEAVRAITRFGFETVGANKIEIRCDPRNLSSRRVAERSGYQLEGELRNDKVAPDGQLRSTLVFGLVPEDYRALLVPR